MVECESMKLIVKISSRDSSAIELNFVWKCLFVEPPFLPTFDEIASTSQTAFDLFAYSGFLAFDLFELGLDLEIKVRRARKNLIRTYTKLVLPIDQPNNHDVPANPM